MKGLATCYCSSEGAMKCNNFLCHDHSDSPSGCKCGDLWMERCAVRKRYNRIVVDKRAIKGQFLYERDKYHGRIED